MKLEQQLGAQDTAQQVNCTVGLVLGSTYHRQSLRGEIARLEVELGTYAHIVEVKDRSIVKLSNELHEFDLSAKVADTVNQSYLILKAPNNLFLFLMGPTAST